MSPKKINTAKEILITFLIISRELIEEEERLYEAIRYYDKEYEEIYNEARKFFDKNYGFSCFNLALSYLHMMNQAELENDKEDIITIGSVIGEICKSFGINFTY